MQGFHFSPSAFQILAGGGAAGGGEPTKGMLVSETLPTCCVRHTENTITIVHFDPVLPGICAGGGDLEGYEDIFFPDGCMALCTKAMASS